MKTPPPPIRYRILPLTIGLCLIALIYSVAFVLALTFIIHYKGT